MLCRGGQKMTFAQTKCKASQVFPYFNPHPRQSQQQLPSSNLAVLFLINRIFATFFFSAEKWAQIQAQKSMYAFSPIFQVSGYYPSLLLFMFALYCGKSQSHKE